MDTLTLETLGSPKSLSHDALTLAARRLATDLALGADPSVRIGAGIEYAQSRPYRPGDSIRRMDWRITARKGEPYSREYEELHRTPFYIVVDTSPSMLPASTAVSKLDAAVWLATALGLLALKRTSPVAILGTDDNAASDRPSMRSNDLWSAVHSLSQCAGGADALVSLRRVAARARVASVIIVISDFQDPAILTSFTALAPRHDTLSLHVTDPLEHAPPRLGFVDAVEAESGRRFLMTDFSRRTLSVARADFVPFGCDYLHLPTDKPFIAPLRAMLASRSVGARRSR